MPEIDVGVSYEEAEKHSRGEPLPADTYVVQIVDANLTATSKGRPMIAWQFEVVEHPKYAGRQLFYNTPLAHEGDESGVGLLYALAKAVGVPWRGKRLNPDNYLGLQCLARVGQREFEGETRNEIRRLMPLP